MSALEAEGRATEVVGARSLRLPLERARYELSKDDASDRPSRVAAERRALGRLAGGVWRGGRTICLSRVMVERDELD